LFENGQFEEKVRIIEKASTGENAATLGHRRQPGLRGRRNRGIQSVGNRRRQNDAIFSRRKVTARRRSLPEMWNFVQEQSLSKEPRPGANVKKPFLSVIYELS
jgi:hypothetical protein